MDMTLQVRMRWTLCIVAAWWAWGLCGAASAQEETSLGSLSPEPPRAKSITYVGKEQTTDFSSPGLGAHLKYFPAFGDAFVEHEDAFQNRTDCTACLEETPDFENFKHHVPLDTAGRTFSPDAAGVGLEGTPGYVPEGVKTDGGNASWDTFTIRYPGDTLQTGLSGTTYDTHACGNLNNFINQMRINTDTLNDFCLNVITDNTNQTHDPDVRIEARADSNDLNNSLEGHPDLVFDGQTDMYTFRYMGMEEGDRVKVRIASSDSGPSCGGPGVGGIMISEINTCTPAAGMCTPSCDGKICGDDGCGGSCGICPRADRLAERTGHIELTLAQGGGADPVVDANVETVVDASDRLSGFLDDTQSQFHRKLEEAVYSAFQNKDGRLRNFAFALTPKLSISAEAKAGVSEGDGQGGPGTPYTYLDFSVELDSFWMRADFKPENTSNARFQSNTYASGIRIRGHYGPIDVPGTAPTFTNPSSEIDAAWTDTDSNDALDALTGILDFVFLSVLTPEGSLLIDLFDVEFEEYVELPDGAPEDTTIIPTVREFSEEIGEKLREKLEEELGSQATELFALLLPGLAVIPDQVEVAGVDFAPELREILVSPEVGQRIDIVYDRTSPQLISGSDPTRIWRESTLTLDVDGAVFVEASVRETTSPPIVGAIDSAHVDANGDYRVEGWACAQGIEESIEVGIFSDGYAADIDLADVPAEPAVAQACGTDGGYSAYRYALAATPAQIATTNVWDNEIHLLAGYNSEDDTISFEKNLGSISRTTVAPWLPNHVAGSPTFNGVDSNFQYTGDFNGDGLEDLMWNWNGWQIALASANGDGFEDPSNWLPTHAGPGGTATHNQLDSSVQFIGDFNGDGLDDYMWEWGGWHVALSTGNGFAAPTTWLVDADVPAGYSHNPHGQFEYVGDFNGDGLDDYMWNYNGWHVALSNGNGFEAPQIWLANQSATGQTYNSVNSSYQYIGDFNGDGRDDYLWEWHGWHVALASPSGFGFEVPTTWLGTNEGPGGKPTHNPVDSSMQFVGDFNGDGNDDFMWEYDGWHVALSSGSAGGGFLPPTTWLANTDAPNGLAYNPNGPYELVADMNGDGSEDYVWNNNGWQVALSNGSGFGEPKLWRANLALGGTVTTYSAGNQYLGDFTGNGFPDLLFRDGYHGWHVASTTLPDSVGGIGPDSDQDGIADAVDNCRDTPNGPNDASNQLDADQDGYGNICDADFDQSGVVAGSDYSILLGAFGTADPVVDLNGDGVVGGSDFSALLGMFGTAPGPSEKYCAESPPVAGSCP